MGSTMRWNRVKIHYTPAGEKLTEHFIPVNSQQSKIETQFLGHVIFHILSFSVETVKESDNPMYER